MIGFYGPAIAYITILPVLVTVFCDTIIILLGHTGRVASCSNYIVQEPRSCVMLHKKGFNVSISDQSPLCRAFRAYL